MSMSGSDLVALVSLVITVLGVALAVVQMRETARVKKLQRQQLLALLERANYAGFEHELFDQLAKDVNDKIALRYLASAFQAAVDLYLMMVTFYLQNEARFTYADLKALCRPPIVTQRWQEDYWRAMVGARAENKGAVPPAEPFLIEPRTGRTAYYRAARDESHS